MSTKPAQNLPRGTTPVAKLRVAAGLSQKQLAERAEISVTTVVNIEAGRADVTGATAVRLAKALGVTVDAYLRALLAYRRQLGAA